MRSILILLLLAATAQAQWATPPWPSTSYPRKGAEHLTNGYEAERERGGAIRVVAGGISGERWAEVYAGDENSWSISWARGYFGTFSMIDLYRSQRDMLVNQKYMLTNMIPYYANTNYATDFEGELSFVDHLNLNNEIPMLTSAIVLAGAGAPTNYFTSTPYRALFDSEYGWKHFPAILNQLVATVGDVSWTNTVECTSATEYDWGVSVTATNTTNYVTDSFYNIAPPSDHYGWWLFDDTDTCPYLSATWPSADWAAVACAPGSGVAEAAPLYTGYLDSDINFEQSAYYTLINATGRSTGEWSVVLFSGVNTQNTYEVGTTVRASDPIVTNLLIKTKKTVQFYAKYQQPRSTYSNLWYRIETITGTTNHSVKGSQFDPSDYLNGDTETAVGSCDSCWASGTNAIATERQSYDFTYVSGPEPLPSDNVPCIPDKLSFSCWHGPTQTARETCVWTNTQSLAYITVPWTQTCITYNAACQDTTNTSAEFFNAYSNIYNNAYEPIGGYTRVYTAGDCSTLSNWCDFVINNHPSGDPTIVTTVLDVIYVEYIDDATYLFEVDGADITYTNEPEFKAVVWWDVPDGFDYTNGTSSL